MSNFRAVRDPARPNRRRVLSWTASGIIAAGALGPFASAEEKPVRKVDVNWPLPVIQPARVQHVEYTEKQPAVQRAPAPAPVALRQEGMVLVGRTSMIVDGIRIGIDLSRLDEPPADADPDAPQGAWQKIQFEEGAFDCILFIGTGMKALDNLPELGNGMKPIDKLEELLDQEMNLVESVRPLELDLRRKLRLAARGDMHRVLQEIEDLRPKFDQIWTVPESEARKPFSELSALTREASRVRNLLFAEAFRADSRFDRNLRRMVTETEYATIVKKRNQTPPAPRVRKVFKLGSGR